jgi:hypothetical protein
MPSMNFDEEEKEKKILQEPNLAAFVNTCRLPEEAMLRRFKYYNER